MVCYGPMSPPPITLCVLARDEADKIAHALESAKACPWVTELLVHDTGSTDETPAIAERYADRVEHHQWVDFTTNRRQLVDAASHDWVFILDADEQVTPELSAEVTALADADFEAHPIFTMPRRNYLLGRHVRAWDPDRIDRLFDRTRVTWPKRHVHDTRTPTEGTAKPLRHPITHNRHANDFGDYFDGDRYERRAEALAQEMYDRGKRAGLLDLVFRHHLAFWKFYLVKRGFLDGKFGLLIAQKAAFSVQLKYARLWHMQQEKRSP